jgi:hypothetical protein
MKKHQAKKSVWLITLKPRYIGSYVAMGYGFGMAAFGHVWSRPVMASAGGLVFYGALLYYARKRERFCKKQSWLALELWAGLSVTWMAVNILRTQVWQWRPLTFGLTPLIVIGAYLVALTGNPSLEKKKDTHITFTFSAKKIPLIIMITAAWTIVHFYVFPKMQITT